MALRNSEMNTGQVSIPGSVVSVIQFVTFMLGSELYGIDIQNVEEIVGMTHINSVPDGPVWMKGVINLREKVIPVIDMRLRFRMPENEYTDTTVILIVSFKGKSIGLVVDSVSDVNSLDVSLVQDAPHFASDVESAVIRGICPVNDVPVVLLDLDRLLTSDELAALDAGTAA